MMLLKLFILPSHTWTHNNQAWVCPVDPRTLQIRLKCTKLSLKDARRTKALRIPRRKAQGEGTSHP